MIPKLKISSFLLKRLEKVKQQCSGCLFGIFYGDGTLLLLGFNLESTIGQLNYKNIQHRFPAEMDLCGLVKFGDCTDNECHLNEIIQDVDITDNPILLHCKIELQQVELKASIFMHGKLQDIPYEVMDEEELYNSFCFTRLQCNFKLYTVENEESIKKDIQELRKKVASGRLAFNIKNSNIFLTAGENGRTANQTAPTETKIVDVLKCINVENDINKPGDSLKKAHKKKNQNDKEKRTDYDIVNIDMLKNRTREPNSDQTNNEGLPSMAMRIYREKKKILIPLEVDAMAILHIETKLLGLYDILIESICRSLRLIENSLVERLNDIKQNTQNIEGNPEIQENKNKIKLSKPEVYHFCPNDFGHFVTAIYLKDLSDDLPLMQQKRKKFNHQFGLSQTKPHFRRGNQYLFKENIPLSPLIDTHLGLKPSGVKNGKQYIVQLHYSYYHYMQQNYDDNGWGCAYRSLQTLCSWFKWHGYTNDEVPTHEKIQKYLYDIGDKAKSFIGSKQWIGSTEVSMCLQGFLGVDSKILHCKSGGDLAHKGYDLAMHFETQGTPIMVGGGVLAHTIIGIDFNEETKEIKFLILDPHYTGEDDLNIIQSKGWCGWKGTDFWDKKSYYNLCMPQRPIIY